MSISVKKAANIRFQDIHLSFGKLQVLKGLNLEIKSGTLTCLIGESGCGKTTSLQLMNGMLMPDSGQVLIDGKPFEYSHRVNLRRHMGYCLQGYTLFPHMNVFENMSLVAKKSGWKKQQLKTRSLELLELVHLDPEDIMFKYPRQLSGGQKQRIGIARALFMTPKVLLMDEPFGALDPITREELQNFLLELMKKIDTTIVMVTHDISEAFRMSHEVVLLKDGKVSQIGSPNQLLLNPKSEYVSSFVKSKSPAQVLKKIRVDALMDTQNLTSIKNKDNNISSHTNFVEALETLLGSGEESLAVVDAKGVIVGSFGKESIRGLL